MDKELQQKEELDKSSHIEGEETRKGSASSAHSSHSGPSFTQRLIERGVAVPSSFSNWDKVRSPEEPSSSPGSYDFDSYYGMSPFITPSFSTAAQAASEAQDGLYRSLRHRYEREKTVSSTGVNSARVFSEDDEDLMLQKTNSGSTASWNPSSVDSAQTKKFNKRAEDSDIELSDDEDHAEASQDNRLSVLLPLNQRASRRSRSPLSFPPTNASPTHVKKNGFFDPKAAQDYLSMLRSPDDTPKQHSAHVEKLKRLLTTLPPSPSSPSSLTPPPPPLPLPSPPQQEQPKPLPRPPRQHLLHTPVFQVINANTVKDRYLFLFSDLLLICKPIMDENIIVSTSKRNSMTEKNRYRFRPNEHSLFQVKNIVQLGQLTLYLSKEDTSHKPQSVIEMDSEGRPILPPARKIHPLLASALRKFETDANLGIQYLIDKGVLTNDPMSIANFLFKTPDLNRRQLGYYLSDAKHSDVYDAFLECFRMVGLRMDEALRILLTTFRLPSHWEALEYLIERFAKKWHDANQNVIKFHEDMVVKVVVAMLFLNAEYWFDATSEKDVFWYARELKERQDRQAKRKMSVIDYRNVQPVLTGNPTDHRQSVAIEPLHYIMSVRAKGDSPPSLEDFLERWNYYDQYHLVPREFMEEMYRSIKEERLETGWDNKANRCISPPTIPEDDEQVVSPSIPQQHQQDVVITVIPHRLPSRLTKGYPSDPITICIPAPDKGLQIKLRGQDLVFEPNVLDFSHSCIQTFTITGNTLGRTSLMFIKTGDNAGNYVSPTLPRTKSVIVERPFMRYTFQVGFKHMDSSSADKETEKNKMLMEEEQGIRKKEASTSVKSVNKSRSATRRGREEKEHQNDDDEEEEEEDRKHLVNRKYTFSVETEEERIQWIEALKQASGQVNDQRNEKVIQQMQEQSSEAHVALQVLKEVLLADELKKGTLPLRSNENISVNEITSATLSQIEDRHNRTMRLLLPAKKKPTEDDRSSIITTSTTASTSTTANVVTKRGHEIVKLVVQNSMVPLVLGFLKSQIP
ncbi:hypothetical protein CU098_008770 [Rhizopus stolonifer]|uniref:SEC7 domain-containing protein n=1 Tax=Rhizopus stolonifer TaxID=4846 RepID=A0A367KNJ8_RHIST|nr:hypothetical protein CU098_008770 [Rhizopus stolonifer]